MSISPSSSASYNVRDFAIPEFPFAGRIGVGELGDLQTTLLLRYYESLDCYNKLVAAVVATEDSSSVESIAVSVVSSSSRNKRQRKKRLARNSQCGSLTSSQSTLGCEQSLVNDVSAVLNGKVDVHGYALTRGAGFEPVRVVDVGSQCEPLTFSQSTLAVQLMSVSDDLPVSDVSGVVNQDFVQDDQRNLSHSSQCGSLTFSQSALGCEKFLGVDVSESLDDGCCYLAVVCELQRKLVFGELGRWPTIKQMLMRSASEFLVHGFARYSLVRVGSGKFHVQVVEGMPGLKPTLAAMVSGWREGSYPVGSLAAVAKTWSFDLKLVGFLPSVQDTLGGPSELKVWLAQCIGADAYAFDAADVAIVSSSAAFLSGEKKKRLKSFETAGDCALTMAISTRCLREHRSAEDFQNARSVISSNLTLSRVFVQQVPSTSVQFAAGVSPGQGKSGANALESILGLIYHELGMEAVTRVCGSLRLFQEWEEWRD